MARKGQTKSPNLTRKMQLHFSQGDEHESRTTRVTYARMTIGGYMVTADPATGMLTVARLTSTSFASGGGPVLHVPLGD